MLQAALGFADLGYHVFPCAAEANPVPLTRHGFKDATTDSEQIERWWAQHPKACIGLATHGLLVVDIDAPLNPWLADQPDRLMELVAAPSSITPSGGRHHVFRQPDGKAWRCTVGQLAPHVDTRTDGGYIVVPPSMRADGSYRWIEGCELDVSPDRLSDPPSWLTEQLDALATGSNTSPRIAAALTDSNQIPSGQRNATLARLGGTMRRVGMGQIEIVAALQQTNIERCSPPLSPAEVERIAASVACYEPDQIAVAVAENHWEQMHAESLPEKPAGSEDPGPIPSRLLHVPGFVGEVMDFCLETAPYPNQVMAFCGALALQAFLAGRKVRDPGDNRTNLYLLGLAHSAAGKDWPRKLNTRILHEVGLADGLGERFASGEGIQDALFLSPSMMFQTDEIDSMLQSINKSRDARHENVMSTLLTMYSSANSVFPMRRKAGKESPGAIDQPCLTIFGTAIPNHYYEALSERMLTNGFFARMLILECGKRGAGQEPQVRELPERIAETATWWHDFQPGTGNLGNWHPVPAIVAHDDAARKLLITAREEAEAEYAKAESASDSVGTTVWGRVNENIRKLTLLYAVSCNHLEPVIDSDAVAWATALVHHLTRRMLFMAELHVSESDFEGRCQRVVELLHEWRDKHGDAWMAYGDVTRKLRWSRREHEEIRHALIDQEAIETDLLATGGRPKIVYRLRSSNNGRAIQ